MGNNLGFRNGNNLIHPKEALKPKIFKVGGCFEAIFLFGELWRGQNPRIIRAVFSHFKVGKSLKK